MTLAMGDSHVIRDITVRCCVVSLISYSIATLLLYFTDYYLLAGKREFINIHIIFMLIDIMKWLYHKILLEKDFRIIYKKKSLGFFSLFIKCFDVIHLFKSIVFTILGSIAYHIVAVFFGALAFDKYKETYLFGLHMSILTVFPMYLNYGYASFTHLVSGHKPYNMFHNLLYRSFQVTLFGAWCGAVVIPLDWDRPWQEWPIPCSFGALIACTASYLIMYVHIYIFPLLFNGNFKKK